MIISANFNYLSPGMLFLSINTPTLFDVKMQNSASQYILRVGQRFAAEMQSKKIKGINAVQRKRIAAIVTGLSIITNEKFRQTLRVSDDDLKTIIDKLQTDKLTADKVAQLGSRAPTMLAKNEQVLVYYESRSLQTKNQFVLMLRNLAEQLGQMYREINKTNQQQTST